MSRSEQQSLANARAVAQTRLTEDSVPPFDGDDSASESARCTWISCPLDADASIAGAPQLQRRTCGASHNEAGHCVRGSLAPQFSDATRAPG